VERRPGGVGGMSPDDGGREVNFRVLSGFNHYPHWDNTDEFTKRLAEIV